MESDHERLSVGDTAERDHEEIELLRTSVSQTSSNSQPEPSSQSSISKVILQSNLGIDYVMQPC